MGILGDITGAIGDGIGAVGSVVDDATGGLASTVLNATDDYVFDTVDYVTDGAVNIDYDNGNFSVGLGFEGYAYAGASIGESGISTSGDVIGGSSYDFGVTNAGFVASGSAGIDWGPLPYAEGHVQVAENGDVNIGGRAQGTLPTQYGIFSGRVAGGIVSNEDGWGVYENGHGSWTTPTGVTFAGGQGASYQETAAGSRTSVEVDGSVSYAGATVGGGVGVTYDDTASGSHTSVDMGGSASYLGLGHVGGTIGYDRVDDNGNVTQDFHGSVNGEALGFSGHAQADYHESDVNGVEHSGWSGDASYDGFDSSPALHAAEGFAHAELGSGSDGGDASGFDGGGNSGDAGYESGGYSGDAGYESGGYGDGGSDSGGGADDFGQAIQTADDIDTSMGALAQDLP
jgi:hypothetical protein